MIDNSCPLHTIPRGASFSIHVLGRWEGALVALKAMEVTYKIGDDETVHATLDKDASVSLPAHQVPYDLNLTFSDATKIDVDHDFRNGYGRKPSVSTFTITVEEATESGKYNAGDAIATIRMVRNLLPGAIRVHDPLVFD